MKVSLRSAGGMWAVGVAMLLLAGCSGKPSRVHPDAIAGDAPQKAMDLYDTDQDGFIDGAELDKVPGLKAALKQVDTNGDGKIPRRRNCGPHPGLEGLEARPDDTPPCR